MQCLVHRKDNEAIYPHSIPELRYETDSTLRLLKFPFELIKLLKYHLPSLQ